MSAVSVRHRRTTLHYPATWGLQAVGSRMKRYMIRMILNHHLAWHARLMTTLSRSAWWVPTRILMYRSAFKCSLLLPENVTQGFSGFFRNTKTYQRGTTWQPVAILTSQQRMESNRLQRQMHRTLTLSQKMMKLSMNCRLEISTAAQIFTIKILQRFQRSFSSILGQRRNS